jgi:hypothetical protein
MAEFSIGLFETGEAEYSDFKEFISIVSRRSIVSAADWGEGRFELGLSGNLMVWFFPNSRWVSYQFNKHNQQG